MARPVIGGYLTMTERIRRTTKAMLLALPLACGWTIYTGQATLGNFLLGYIFSMLVVLATGLRGESLKLSNAFRQLFNLLAYIVFMAFEVLFAGVKVARIVLTPHLPINPGFSVVNTGDISEDELISAISAHGITITPGELVVDFQETEEDGILMIVHSLDVDASADSLEHDQAKRLGRIKGILGHD